jgi:S-adenosylmethionine:tRNA-ribosyltransferase-isomerase (queuine synthetase)
MIGNKNGYSLLTKKRVWARKIELIKRLGGKCVKCGITDIRVLDVNHKDPTKKERPKDRKYNWTRRFKEWNKNFSNIELLCSNCHRIHTWQQRNFGLKSPKEE